MAAEVVVAGNMAADGLHDVCEASLVLVERASVVKVVTLVVVAGVRAVVAPGLAMGFARLAGGRTTVIVDAASPPDGRAGGSAHASTLGFEMTSGRRPVIVSCGSGAVRGGMDPCGPGHAVAFHAGD